MDASTIVAIATAQGPAGIAMIRLSGSEASTIAARIFRPGRGGRPPEFRAETTHKLHYGKIVDPISGLIIDEVMLGWMAAPRTYTREDTIEITCHGGSVPASEILRLLLAQGARHAEPGEFTLRAFLNGRLDLTEAEAVLSVVTARTAEGLRLAVTDLAGELKRRLRPARDATIGLLAYLDAAADFPEDEIPIEDIDLDLRISVAALESVIAGSRAGRLYAEGVQIALVGKPNVGKSSLMNALLRSDRAIVTSIAGTTRDVISEQFNLSGVPATLLDTAGIAESDNVIERLGIERSRSAMRAAAAAVLVLDGSCEPDDDDRAIGRLLADRLTNSAEDPAAVVVAVNKSDLPARARHDSVIGLLPGCVAVNVSAQSGEGLAELEAALTRVVAAPSVAGATPAMITTRQHAALDRALFHLREAIFARKTGFPIDLLATDVRAASFAIGQVTGENVDEAVLTEIFSRFCIGK